MENKRYKAIYGDGDYDYFYFYENELGDYEKEKGYVSELTLFHRVFTGMILSNDILEVVDYNKWDVLVSGYNDEEEDYVDEYQFFIVDTDSFIDKDDLIKLVKLMGNTLYYCEDLGNYVMGVTDLGTSRDYVLTDLKLELDGE